MTERRSTKGRAAIYREAARRIEKGMETFSCCAISDAQGRATHVRGPHHKFYIDLFTDGSENDLQDAICEVGTVFSEDRQNLRALLLCMAAAVAERP